MGTDVKDLDAPVGRAVGRPAQSVAICRSVMWANKVVFMDEPTAALGVRQTGKVLELIRRVADQGVAVVLISHNMPEVLEVSDRIQVLRLGRRVAQFRGAEATVEQLVGAMTGALEVARRRSAVDRDRSVAVPQRHGARSRSEATDIGARRRAPPTRRRRIRRPARSVGAAKLPPRARHGGGRCRRRRSRWAACCSDWSWCSASCAPTPSPPWPTSATITPRRGDAAWSWPSA